MISTIKLTGSNIDALCNRIKTEGLGCLDRIDSLTLCKMLLGITSDRFGESSVIDITNGILNSCGDQSPELGIILTNRYKLGLVWKFIVLVKLQKEVILEVQLNKIPHSEGRNSILITLQYDTVAKELDGTEYNATVARPLIEYTNDHVVVYKVSDSKMNFERGNFNTELLHPKPIEEPEPSTEEIEDDSKDQESVPAAEEEQEAEDDRSTGESVLESDIPTNEQSEPDSPATDDSGDGQESAEPEEGDAGSEPDGGTDGNDAPIEETQEEEMPEASQVQYGPNSVVVDFVPEWANATVDEITEIVQKSGVADKIPDMVGCSAGEPSGVPVGSNVDVICTYTDQLLNKLLKDEKLKEFLKDHGFEIGGVRYVFERGYTVEVRVLQPEREKAIEEAMKSDKDDQPVKTDFVDITDPEYRNGTLLAMFGTTAPSANHVHTFLNEYHNSMKTKSFLETKIDGQGTYPTESDVFYDNIVWAFVKMKDGKFWRIAIANRDFSLEDESWIATHHFPGRWVTIAEVQDGPNYHGYRRRNW